MPKGLVFPCSYCQKPVESPGSDITAEGAAQYQQWAMQHGAAAASLADQQYREQHDPANTVFASVSTITGTIVAGKPYFLGASAAQDGTWSMRLVDGASRQIVWEALAGSRWSFPPDEQKIAFRSERLFIAIEGALHCLDVSSGRVLWSVTLHGEVETHPSLAAQGDEVMIYDFPVAQGEGAVAAYTKSGVIAAWGRDSGRPLWSQHWDSARVHPLPGMGLILDNGDAASVVRALDGAVLAQWADDDHPDDIMVGAGRIALHVQVEVDDSDQDRVRILDAATLQVLCEHPVKDQSLEEAGFVGARLLVPVYARTWSTYQLVDPANPPKEPGFFAKLFGGGGSGGARHSLPVPGMRFERILHAGGLVFCDVRVVEGEGRRIFGLDATTLQPRFDSGPLSSEPTNMDDQQIQTNGRVAVYVTAPTGDDQQCELRALDCTTGAQLWQMAIGDWTSHSVHGEQLIVNHHPPGQGHTVTVLSVADGSVVGRCPFV
ncbi:MAG: PQQ-binding-like beta-propeller repeat protein [Myxococcota bacterium]